VIWRFFDRLPGPQVKLASGKALFHLTRMSQIPTWFRLTLLATTVIGGLDGIVVTIGAFFAPDARGFGAIVLMGCMPDVMTIDEVDSQLTQAMDGHTSVAGTTAAAYAEGRVSIMRNGVCAMNNRVAFPPATPVG